MDVERIEALVNLMKSEGIAELTVDSPDFKIAIKRDLPQAAPLAPAPGEPHIESYTAQAVPAATGPVTVSSPAVGRLQPAEGLEPGQLVAAGQVLAVVESMRIPNEVRAPVAGTIVEIMVHEGSVVEYGQPLMTIDPSREVTVDEFEL